MNLLERAPVAWTIAGSDSGGGAGVQADLLTFKDFAVHGCSAITALTAQNSFAVGHIAVTGHQNLVAQINALDSDLPADAIKLGMLPSPEIVASVAKYLDDYSGPVVCDPVIQSSSGQALQNDDAARVLREQLLPRVDLLTPNREEAEALLGRPIPDSASVPDAARDMVALGARSVLITGGHFDPQAGHRVDYWTDGEAGFWLAGPALDTVHTHGSGCTLSSAAAAALAQGYDMRDALVLAKAYVTAGVRAARQLGSGPGPVAHRGWPRTLKDLPTVSAELPRAATADTFARCDGALGLYPVVDSSEWVARLLDWGVDTVQLRIKNLEPGPLQAEIERSVALARARGARLFINDHWQTAIAAGAYGVHLGQEDLDTADISAIRRAGLRLGVSTHSYYEIARAHRLRPSYIALGPIYPTDSKPMAFGPQGLERLREWVSLLQPGYSLTAIGGINTERAPAVLATGVGSCAMISAITRADDPAAVVRQLLALHGSVY